MNRVDNVASRDIINYHFISLHTFAFLRYLLQVNKNKTRPVKS